MYMRLLFTIIAPAMLLGCSNTKLVTVEVPPRMDLQTYRTIGLVGFASNADDELAKLSTRKFLEAIQSAQPGTRVVELGTETQMLSTMGSRSWDPKTLRTVKEAHGVDALIVGKIDIEKARPDVKLSTLFQQMSLSAHAEASLGAKILETDTGATRWSNSAEMTTKIAHASFNTRGEGFFGAKDPEAAYGSMIRTLVRDITGDFRTHYVKRRVPKDEIQTASGRD